VKHDTKVTKYQRKKGKRLTPYKILKTDPINAGANWKDAEVVVDNGLIWKRILKNNKNERILSVNR